MRGITAFGASSCVPVEQYYRSRVIAVRVLSHHCLKPDRTPSRSFFNVATPKMDILQMPAETETLISPDLLEFQLRSRRTGLHARQSGLPIPAHIFQ